MSHENCQSTKLYFSTPFSATFQTILVVNRIKGLGRLNLNIAHLQFNHTGFSSCRCVQGLLCYSAFKCASFKILGGFIIWGVRNKTAEKRLKMAFSSCWFFLICTLPYIFHYFIRTILFSSMLCENCENTRKSLNYKYGFGSFQNDDFLRLFEYGGKVVKPYM